MLVTGFTPTYAAAFAIVAVVVSSWLTPNKMGPKAIIEALALGTRNMVSTAILLISVGIVVMAVSTTGVGNTLSLVLADLAGGSLFIALLLVALISLVLGMGLPVTADYIVLATLSAPAIRELILNDSILDHLVNGTLPQAAQSVFMLVDPDALTKLAAPMSLVEAQALYAMVPRDFASTLFEQALDPALLTTALLSAHMIIFWLSQDSNVTPPVCLAAFAAAAIAKTPPMATGLTAWRIAKGLYIIPVLFAYTPILSGDWLLALQIALFAAIGIYALAAGFEGFAEQPVKIWLRPFIFLGGIALIWPMPVLWHVVAAAAVLLMFLINYKVSGEQVSSSPVA